MSDREQLLRDLVAAIGSGVYIATEIRDMQRRRWRLWLAGAAAAGAFVGCALTLIVVLAR